jgi:DNA-binding transcriptional MerR regulator
MPPQVYRLSAKGMLTVQAQEPARFTLAELVEASGVPERTIRFYVSEGLVPPALGRGKSRYYTPQHLEALAFVSGLRGQRLSIDEIRTRLSQSSNAESIVSGDIWERILLHDGLELHIRSNVPESVRSLAEELRLRARQWFGEHDSDPGYSS